MNINSDWKEITFEYLCDNYKDNWLLQCKFPKIDVWIDYDIKNATIISFISFKQMNVMWRYKEN